ncbi:hypothetical protein Tco_1191892 [Tanacetum coccineum]
MDDPNITMEEYIQLEEEKARRCGQEFNWETSTYGKVKYFEDINYFKDFGNKFPAIVYRDALVSKPEVTSEPTEYTKKPIHVVILTNYTVNIKHMVKVSEKAHILEHEEFKKVY